jgi:DNA-binding response OmpR family regulator
MARTADLSASPMPTGTAKTVLVVEDDAAIRRGVCDALKFSGYRVLDAADGKSGLALATTSQVDLILLDILMPHMTGLEVLAALRQSRRAVPVIFLTAKGLEEDRIKGLRLGADDYVVKPFSAAELLARVEAVLRRSSERPKPLTTITLDGKTIDFERRQVLREDGTSVVLPETEANLLAYLAENRSRAIDRDELLLRVWGLDPKGVQTRTVDMTVARLREHLGDDPDSPRIILTVRGKGYMLGADAANSSTNTPAGTTS